MASLEPRKRIQEIIDQLQTPIPDFATLLSLLTAPLDALSLLPPQFLKHNKHPLPPKNLNVKKYIPQFQHALLVHVQPTWEAVFEEHKAMILLEQYFCPDGIHNVSSAAGEIALLGYSTLVSTRITAWSIRLLARLVVEYPVDRLHNALFSRKDLDKATREVGWEDCVKNICMVPGKVANALSGRDIPLVLENAAYFNNLCARFEVLIQALCEKGTSLPPSIDYLLTKLVNVGVFPAKPPISRSQPSFWQTVLPTIRSKLGYSGSEPYSLFWGSIFSSISSELALQSILTSLFSCISLDGSPLDSSPSKRSRIKQEANLLYESVGELLPSKSGLWEIATSLMIGRDWDESHARIYVCWMSGALKTGKVDVQTLSAFLQSVLELWSSTEFIKHSLLSKHRYITALLLITLSYFPISSQVVRNLSTSPHFLKGISTYISHLDVSVRRCGMLVGEIAAELCNQTLQFGDWGGEDAGKPWCRSLRTLLKARDADTTFAQPNDHPISKAEKESRPSQALVTATKLVKAAFAPPQNGYDSDDSVTGYASPSSSRSASPTPSELEEIAKDPTLNVGKKKVQRPMYLLQLSELLRGGAGKQGPEDPHEADRIAMALDMGEELIRRKRGFGTELEENAVNLVFAYLGLQDNFDLPGFSEKRQGALNALVVGAPTKAAPAMVEQFFKNQYSVEQRFVSLNALAMGARELASLPIPPSRVSKERTAFPSKQLPGPLHRQYLAASQGGGQVVAAIMDQISRNLLDQAGESVKDVPTEITRERRLRLQKTKPVIQEVEALDLNPYSQLDKPIAKPKTRFIDVAAEFFIIPFINRFWLFLRDEQMREERTSHLEGTSKYSGSGTGLILNAFVLAQFLRTMSILVNAAQNAPEWLSIIAPGALELAVTLGTRPITRVDTGEDDEETSEERQNKEASVLTAALELALVILNGSLELDGGRTLSLEHTTLLFGAGEWASKVFADLDKGLRVQGGGGSQEKILNRTAAGVLLKIDELTSTWRQSMLDTR